MLHPMVVNIKNCLLKLRPSDQLNRLLLHSLKLLHKFFHRVCAETYNVIRDCPGYALYRLEVCGVQRAIFSFINNILKIFTSLEKLLMNQIILIYTLMPDLSIWALVVYLRVLSYIERFRQLSQMIIHFHFCFPSFRLNWSINIIFNIEFRLWIILFLHFLPFLLQL